ncbi:L-serine ammonia-lyase [Actinokineospora xionganensis]|uniref:L-serine dehydratase n=1 Tax=Actinokineospora xionganensis TaxID=2684470 RepID=A0ABR7L594_9PSEU|nr:L-serine ammonia-lyase [Actinokineospora xionganensis]MBC6447853.1 L-serine ammonia-lyase [Actinokineospora xionganensis]
MAISVFDLFSIGIGPSSSHTVGPMRAALMFIDGLSERGDLERVTRVRVELFGSLGATGHGHGSDKAVLLGLEGERPEDIDTASVGPRVAKIREEGQLRLLGRHTVAFTEDDDLVMHRRKSLPLHPNGMTFAAWDESGGLFAERTYYSVGGGFVLDETAADGPVISADTTPVPFPFRTGAELMEHCAANDLTIAQVMLRNELVWRTEAEVRAGLLAIWQVMRDCVARGCEQDGVLPGGLKVPRRAKALHEKLLSEDGAGDPLYVMDWVTLFALAVNEENASGGRIVTAPTNGAAGIIPAVLHYYTRFLSVATEDGVIDFLLTAAAIGVVLKETGSISGAEVGCQGEVGSACAMAAAGLTAVLGGSVAQVENAAEIGLEHHLGLTCDPVGGLVQIPCIERNAVGSTKAINASRMALRGDGTHIVHLDKVIKTMRQTGADMHTKYKETSRGGLALNVIEC